jgi:phosphate transport system protein
MQRHFETELDGLKTSLIKMSSIVEQALDSAIKALLNGDAAMAQAVIEEDDRINELEIEIDHAIIDLLALQQPVAIDLRFILAAQKINNDLERIGDHTVNIAQSVTTMAKMQCPLLELPKMSEIAKVMLSNAIDGFIHQDARLAKSVLVQDDKIDELNRSMIQEAITIMKSDPNTIECAMEIIRVSRNLERVGDLSTNIAEEVIFITRAELVKHHSTARKSY